MKRLIATSTVALGLALAGCGGSSHPHASAKSPCVQWRAAAQTYAQNYGNDLPSAPSATATQQLADSTYRVSAAAHGVTCP